MHLAMVFAFPMAGVMGDIACLMAQSRVGHVRINRYEGSGLELFFGSKQVASLDDPSRNFIPMRKVGSR